MPLSTAWDAKRLRGVNQRLEDQLMKLQPSQSGHLNRAFNLLAAELRAAGATSLRAIAAGLNERGIPTARGGAWNAPQVMRVLARGTASLVP